MPVGKWLISNERTPSLLTFRVTKVLPSKLSMLSVPSVSDFPVKLMFSISPTGLGYTFNCWLLTDKSSCKSVVISEKFRYRKSLRANTPLLLSVLVTVRFPEEKLIFCMLLKVYAVCVPLLSFTYKKNYLRDFVSSFGNIKASFIFRSFLTKFDRFAEINTLRQAQGKNKSNSQMNQINSNPSRNARKNQPP